MRKELFILTLAYSLLISTTAFPQGMGHDASGGYTDQEQKITQEYIHDGKVNETYQNERQKQIDALVSGGMSEEEAAMQVDQILGGSPEDYEVDALGGVSLELISQLYTTVIGAMPGSFTTKVAFTDGEGRKSLNEAKDLRNLTEDAKDGQLDRDYGEGPQDILDGGTKDDANSFLQNSDEETINAKIDEKNAQADELEEGVEEKEQEDYCKYVALAGETYFAFKTQMDQETMTARASVSSGNEQIDALYVAKESHVNEAQSCNQKHIVWGSTAACYVALMTASAFAGGGFAGGFIEGGGWKLLLKMGASGLLAFFYKEAEKAHLENAGKIDDILAQMPNKGDCNPVSQRSCYCSQESTMNDAKYCAPQLHSRKIAKNSMRTACIDNKLQADPKCSCIATETCYDKQYMNMLSISGLGTEFTKTALDSMKNVTRGSMTTGNYSGTSDGLNSAQRKLLKKATSFKYNGKLNKDQKGNSKWMEGMGVPANISSALASYPTNSAVKKNMRKLRGVYKKRYTGRKGYARKGKDNNVLYFGGKKKKKGSYARRSRGGKKLAMSKGSNTSSAKILTFAEKAQKASQIGKDTTRPIFETISRRYRVSGWRELEIE